MEIFANKKGRGKPLVSASVATTARVPQTSVSPPVSVAANSTTQLGAPAPVTPDPLTPSSLKDEFGDSFTSVPPSITKVRFMSIH